MGSEKNVTLRLSLRPPKMSAGASEGAVKRARAVRGLRIKPLSLAELASWRPVGTVVQRIGIPGADAERAAKPLREAGLRVIVKEREAQQVRIEVFRHYGTATEPTCRPPACSA
jgi:hypothetical protein